MAGRIPKVDDDGHLPAEVVDALQQDLDFSAASTEWAVVVHGAVASTARPSVTAVYWVGSVTPTNMTANDFYNGPAPA